jgi:hypothetical protein
MFQKLDLFPSLDIGCPVIEVKSSSGPQQSKCLPPHLRTNTDPVSEMLCSLVSRIPDDGRTPKTQ